MRRCSSLYYVCPPFYAVEGNQHTSKQMDELFGKLCGEKECTSPSFQKGIQEVPPHATLHGEAAYSCELVYLLPGCIQQKSVPVSSTKLIEQVA
eukprot:365734-Chlamydomonas_euryale.AAC.11